MFFKRKPNDPDYVSDVVGMVFTFVVIVLVVTILMSILLFCAGLGGGAYLLYEWHEYLTPEGWGLQPTQLAK